jgi:RNA polymerase sigma-70 factor (ECF subfamily)
LNGTQVLLVHYRTTSHSLLQRAQGQDQEAWCRLVYLYSPLVHYWCLSWGVQGADADDISQEVFKSVSAALESFRRDRPGDTFRGWLRVIAQRKFLDQCRLKQRTPEATGGSGTRWQQLAIPENPEDDPPDEVNRLHHRALELVRSEFEERTWQAFWKCAVDGMAPADVAEEMSMKPAAVRQAKSRVLRRLKEELGDLLG